jgi:hypothetical protein
MSRPSLKCGILPCLVFAVTCVATALAKDLSVTAPGHYRTGPAATHFTAPSRDETQARVRELPSAVMLHEDRRRAITEMAPDRRLSESCRAGKLRQYRNRQFAVRLAGYLHGAAVGGHWSLIDPEGQATPGQIYAFRRPNSGRCEIYRID